MDNFTVEGILQELLAEVDVADWDESLGAIISRPESEIAHDLFHALERRGYTLVRKEV